MTYEAPASAPVPLSRQDSVDFRAMRARNMDLTSFVAIATSPREKDVEMSEISANSSNEPAYSWLYVKVRVLGTPSPSGAKHESLFPGADEICQVPSNNNSPTSRLVKHASEEVLHENRMRLVWEKAAARLKGTDEFTL